MGTAVSRRLPNGHTLSVSTNDRVELRRRNYTLLVDTLPKRPEPVHAVRNFQRGRSTSAEQFFRVEDAALKAASFQNAMRYIGKQTALALEHLVTPPDPMQQLDEALDAEQDFQSHADKQQRRMKDYVRAKNVEGLQLVADTAAAHRVALLNIEQAALAHVQTLSLASRLGLRA